MTLTAMFNHMIDKQSKHLFPSNSLLNGSILHLSTFLCYPPPPGFSISVVEEDGVQQLYITDVKAGGLAFAKGRFPPFLSVLALQRINGGGENDSSTRPMWKHAAFCLFQKWNFAPSRSSDCYSI